MPAGSFWRAGNVFFGKRIHLEDVTTGITALAGGGTSGATALSAAINVVSTVASAGDSVKLPVAFKGAFIYVKNTSANSMNVFPQSGGAIDGASADAAKAVAAGVGTIFYCAAVSSAGVQTWVTF